MNITITVPDGSSNHGNPSLLCIPPNWYDYILFFFANYFAHTATVPATPGQGSWSRAFDLIAALLLPVCGIGRAVSSIQRHSRTEKDPLRRAARAGALCMVVKDPAPNPREVDPQGLEAGRVGVSHKNEGQHDTETPVGPEEKTQEQRGIVATTEPVETNQGQHDTDAPTESKEANPGENSVDVSVLEPGHRPHAARFMRERSWWDPDFPHIVPEDTEIYGEDEAPEGYRLAFVPSGAPIEHESPESQNGKQFLEGYNAPKVLISFVQAIWAIITLYQSRGDQIEQYGYAAFGLTVTPYAFMSVMNIIGSLLNPEYPAVFIVRTPTMDEAETSGSMKFTSEIRVKIESEPSTTDYGEKSALADVATFGISVFCGFIPLAIIGGLSKFHPQNSSSIQRGFTMTWLVASITFGPIFQFVGRMMDEESEVPPEIAAMPRNQRVAVTRIPMIICAFIFGAPAIGGMAVVGQMIREYGICTLL